MATLIFDIETAGLPPESFDEVQQEYLFRDAARLEDPAASQKKREELTQMMSLWPFTSRFFWLSAGSARRAASRKRYSC